MNSNPTPDEVRAAAEKLGVDPSEYAAHLMNLSPDEAAREVAGRLKGHESREVDRRLVNGSVAPVEGAELVFIPESRARGLAEVVDAWWTSSTWGELRKRLEARAVAAEFLEGFGYPDEYPADEAPLTDEDKDVYTTDGDWPAWPAAEMLDWVPEDVAEIGESGVSMVSGAALFFDPEREEELVAAFRDHGYTCRRDDDLVQATNALAYETLAEATGKDRGEPRAQRLAKPLRYAFVVAQASVPGDDGIAQSKIEPTRDPQPARQAEAETTWLG